MSASTNPEQSLCESCGHASALHSLDGCSVCGCRGRRSPPIAKAHSIPRPSAKPVSAPRGGTATPKESADARRDELHEKAARLVEHPRVRASKPPRATSKPPVSVSAASGGPARHALVGFAIRNLTSAQIPDLVTALASRQGVALGRRTPGGVAELERVVRHLSLADATLYLEELKRRIRAGKPAVRVLPLAPSADTGTGEPEPSEGDQCP